MHEFIRECPWGQYGGSGGGTKESLTEQRDELNCDEPQQRLWLIPQGALEWDGPLALS